MSASFSPHQDATERLAADRPCPGPADEETEVPVVTGPDEASEAPSADADAASEPPSAAPGSRVSSPRVAIVGATEAAGRLIERIASEQPADFTLLGIFDDRVTRRPQSVHGLRVLGRIDDLVAYAREHSLDRIILALPPTATDRIEAHVARLRSLPVDIVLVDDAADAPAEAGSTTAAEPNRTIWVAGQRLSILVPRPMSAVGSAVKRVVDFTLALSVLLLGAPFLLLIALAIVVDSPGGVLFRQQRIGFNNRLFTILKFRTMAADAYDQEGVGGTKPGDPRVTRVGRVLRRFSIDELPQLLNVITGSMSIVGPRPQAVNMRIGDRFYREAVAEYAERHKVKPGLTGWAQINGSRGGIYSLEKAAWAVSMDLEYIQNWSIWLDLKIMWRTFGMIVLGRDAI